MTSALERAIRAGAAARPVTERCDLCGAALAEDHRHLLDTDRGEVLCSCPACSVLFDRPAASNGHYRRIPRRRVRLPAIDTAPLGVPVGLAFFVPRSDGAVVAHYPSPLGTTDWEIDAASWTAVCDRHPVLDSLEPEVQALLVDTAWGAHEHWLAPLDDCFRLVAIVRREWTGLSGGGTVWPAVARFFGALTERRD